MGDGAAQDARGLYDRPVGAHDRRAVGLAHDGADLAHARARLAHPAPLVDARLDDADHHVGRHGVRRGAVADGREHALAERVADDVHRDDAAHAHEAEGGDRVQRHAERRAHEVRRRMKRGVLGAAGAREREDVDALARAAAVEQRELELDEHRLVLEVAGGDDAHGESAGLGAHDDGDAEREQQHERTGRGRGRRRPHGRRGPSGPVKLARASGAHAHHGARVLRHEVRLERAARDVRVAQRTRHEGARALGRVRAHDGEAAGEPAPRGARPPEPVAQHEHAEDAVGLAEDAQARRRRRRAANRTRDGPDGAPGQARVAVDAARVAVDARLVRKPRRVVAVVRLGAHDAAHDFAELVRRKRQVDPFPRAVVQRLGDHSRHFFVFRALLLFFFVFLACFLSVSVVLVVVNQAITVLSAVLAPSRGFLIFS